MFCFTTCVLWCVVMFSNVLVRFNPKRVSKEEEANDSSTDMWTRVLPKLWSLEFVQSPIEAFILSLPNGRITLNPLMQSLGKKQRQKSSGVKKQKALKTKVFEKELVKNLKESQKSQKETLKELKDSKRKQKVEDKRFDRKNFGEKMERVASKVADINKQRANERLDNKKKNKKKEVLNESPTLSNDNQMDHSNDEGDNDLADQKHRFDRREGEVEVQAIDLNVEDKKEDLSEDSYDINKDDPKNSSEGQNNRSGDKAVIKDSFFVGGQSASDDDDNDDNDHDNEEDELLTIDQGSKSRVERRKNFNVRREVPNKDEVRGRRSQAKFGSKGKNSFKVKQDQRKRDSFVKRDPRRGFSGVSRKPNEGFNGSNAGAESSGKQTLHPSWEAKRGHQKQILPFKGKKVTFDD